MQTSLFSTELGWFAATWSNAGLRELRIGYRTPAAAHRGLCEPADPTSPSRSAQRLITRLQSFAQGECGDDFADVALDAGHLTDFGRAVTACCRRISSGETLTYGELAAEAGYPGAARAVGSVMRRNRWPVIVPCHRVVAAGGHLGGYSAPTGLTMKRRLLSLEGAALATA